MVAGADPESNGPSRAADPPGDGQPQTAPDRPQTAPDPDAERRYACVRVPAAPTIDGKLDDAAWESIAWTSDFTDIEGSARPRPRFRTRTRMAWDDRCFYFAAELEEPHVWGTFTEKNSVMYRENNFEIFIDPDSDGLNYYEFEMSARNVIWELTLPRPYRDGGVPIDPLNVDGLRSAVHVDGTLNDASDEDRGWTLEVAIPWAGFTRWANNVNCPPTVGDTWRVNFSRVEWRTFPPRAGQPYRKLPRRQAGPDNWVWSPIGEVDMHRPHKWGHVTFAGVIGDDDDAD